MRPAVPSRVALALLGVALLTGTVVAVGPAALDGQSEEIVNAENSTGYLQPATNGTSRSGYVHADVDVGVAVAADLAAIRANHEVRSFERRVANAGNRSARIQTIQSSLARLEDRTASVERAQREVRAGYRDRTISRSELARTLARLDYRASAIEEIRTSVEDAATSLNPRPGTAVTNAQNLEAALETIGGPATDRLRERYMGNRSAGASYLSVVGEDGLVVATVTDSELHREALDESEREVGGSDTFSDSGEPEISVALRRAAELYPWTFEQGSAAQPLRGYGDTTVYRITVEHVQGLLSTYLDGATSNVYYEIHRMRADSVPVTNNVTETANGLRMTVNTTHATGPMEVDTVSETTGRAVNARVFIDGTLLGQTGEDGHLWVVQPVDRTTITARTGANMTVETVVG